MVNYLQLEISLVLDAFFYREGLHEARWLGTLEAANIAADDRDRLLSAILEDLTHGGGVALSQYLATRKREENERIKRLVDDV